MNLMGWAYEICLVCASIACLCFVAWCVVKIRNEWRSGNGK